LARKAAEDFRSLKARDNEAWAQAVLAEALLAEGKAADARRAIEQAAAWGAKSQDLSVRLTFTTAAARVRAASGQPEDLAAAMTSLQTVVEDASKAGFVGFQLEARLALGELELKSGKAEQGRKRLQALAQEAAAKSFLLIACKAVRLSS